jgi:hypothetical protein
MLAGIGLTVPFVVPASIVFDLPLVLGLEPKDIAMPGSDFRGERYRCIM